MKRIISIRLASNTIIAINCLALLLHVLILLKILPYEHVWGGRLKNEGDMVLFESLSIVVQGLFLAIVAAKAGYIFKGRFKKTVHVCVWVLFGMMVLNTVGNALSRSEWEVIIMTPLTGMLALLLLRLALD